MTKSLSSLLKPVAKVGAVVALAAACFFPTVSEAYVVYVGPGYYHPYWGYYHPYGYGYYHPYWGYYHPYGYGYWGGYGPYYHPYVNGWYGPYGRWHPYY